MNRLAALSCAFSLGLIGCGWDYTPSDNILPSVTTESEGEPAETESGNETGGAEDLPATYRFDCVDIKSLGDADDTVFQVATLQNTWAADISNYKLNILIDVLAEDPDTSEGTIAIRSGIGPSASNQCSQPDTESAEFAVGFAGGGQGGWEPASGDLCAAPSDTGGAGTYSLSMGADERVFIYAEDDDGTVFNCSVDGNNPDAIPIWAVQSTFTLTDDRSDVAGTLTGCVVQSQALGVCSCLSVCAGGSHPDCGGCPNGSVPLGALLGGINPTQNCSDLMGEPAFDILLEFSASRLGAVPATCGP